jgi:serine/threonine protein kinase
MPESTPLQAGLKLGNARFVLVRNLGRGGMGEVWLAEDERLHQSVALKFLPPEIRGDPVSLDYLRHETARSHQLSHPNIIRIHDLHEDADGTAFIVMEYVDGVTLAELRLQQPNRVLHWDFLRPLLEQLCAALHYAHGEKVIHRDLKPSNMMVDGRGRLKLADFGLAAVVSDSMTRVSGRNLGGGTLTYMSPQQVSGKRPQVTDDIYALGATIYESLTSQPPFHTGDLTHQALHELPEPMVERLAALEIQNEIPPDAAALVMACLAKNPAQRPQSALAVAEWISLEVVRKPSISSLTQDVFSEPPAEISEPEPAGPLKPDGGKKVMWAAAVLGPLLLTLAGIWYLTYHSRARTAVAEAQPTRAPASPQTYPWVAPFDGTTLSGWSAPDGGDWEVNGYGDLVSDGPRSHLFSPGVYTNLEFKAEIKLSRGANGGMFFRTDFINGKISGYEAQAFNGSKVMRTGSLFNIREASQDVAKDNEWFTQHVIAVGNHIVIKVNDVIVVDCIDTRQTHSFGHLALQHWVPPAGSTTWYRNVTIKRLSDDETAAWSEARKDMPDLP